MNNVVRTYGAQQKHMLFWALSLGLMILSGCDAPKDILSTRVVPQPPAVEASVPFTMTVIPTSTVALSMTIPATSTVPSVVLTETLPVIAAMTIKRAGSGENEYFIDGEGFATFNPGDLLVVYAKDAGGFEFDAAVMYVVDKNVDNLIAKTIFQNSSVSLDTLAALRVDQNLQDVNLTRMVSVNADFIGFTVGLGQIRINPNEPVQAGDELAAVKLTAGGNDALPLSPPLLFRVDAVSISGEMASASVVGAAEWPTEWTLLIPQNKSSTHSISVRDFDASNGVCVREGDEVKMSAGGTMIVGEFVGELGPEGKEHFQLMGLFPTPIDPIYDIVPEFPHGVLMFRIADPKLLAAAGWMHYDTTKQFTADKSGCLEFDINDKDNSDNSGAFSVQIEVNP